MELFEDLLGDLRITVRTKSINGSVIPLEGETQERLQVIYDALKDVDDYICARVGWPPMEPCTATEVKPPVGVELFQGHQAHPEAYYHQQAPVAVELCGPPEEVTGPFSALRGLHSHQVLFNLS